ncbi:MAG TPA: CheR family methyltransferase [Bradyrhizobium sp.]|nr:CheR family methyltransferase [Bradyrhizobium sp.]
MNDTECTAFLQWALPQLELRWPGYRKVRRQVCKRLRKHMNELGLADLAAYRSRLASDPAEWRVLDECCHITISRFFRDRGVFEVLRTRVLPDIAAQAKREQRAALIWSAGCASGEEPYTLKILWDLEVSKLCPDVSLSIIATDIDESMLTRAREGCFKPTSLHELPPPLIEQAFERTGPLFCVKPIHREGIEFRYQDLRTETPSPLFDLVLCRYVAFTYFAPALQQQVLGRLVERLAPNGYLAIGTHELLPTTGQLKALPGAPQIFTKVPAARASRERPAQP